MKKLSIIIPYHNETETRISPMFRSMEEQKDIDWETIEIVVSNDHKEPKDMQKFFEQFPNICPHIKYLICPIHFGPGPNRQYAIDHCDGEYIAMWDSDDSLMDDISMKSILKSLSTNSDIYISKELVDEVDFETNRAATMLAPANNEFLHSKIYKKDYLIRNNIRFHNELYIFEDILFNLLIKILNNAAVEEINPYYHYIFNQNSISRDSIGNIKPAAKESWVKIIPYAIEHIQNSSNFGKMVPIELYLKCLLNRYEEYDSNVAMVGKETVKEQVGALVSLVDPTMKIARSIKVADVGDTPFTEWLKTMVNGTDINEIKKKYNMSSIKIRSYVLD